MLDLFARRVMGWSKQRMVERILVLIALDHALLRRDGFMSGMENPVDRRQKLLTLTAQGSALVRDLESTCTVGVAFLAASLAVEEQEQFRLLLARMIAANCPAPDAETRLE